MKKIATLLLAAGLLLGGTTAAQAVDGKWTGGMEFVLSWGQMRPTEYSPRAENYGSNKAHTFHQRSRLWLDLAVSEALKGVVGFEHNAEWGRAGNRSGSLAAGSGVGGALGTRGVSLEVLHMYADWLVPSTDLRVRIGLQPIANPSFVQNSYQVVSEHMAGIVLSYTPAKAPVGVIAWWVRPIADNAPTYTYNEETENLTSNHKWNDIDAFGVAIPLAFDGVKVAPWGMYASVGRDAVGSYAAAGNTRSNFAAGYLAPVWCAGALAARNTPASEGEGTAFWVGLTGELTLFNPFRLAWDFNYGSVDLGKVRVKNSAGEWENTDTKLLREGYILNILAEYKLDFATPGIAYWYGSGDGSKWYKGSGMMPSLRPSSKMTSFGQETQSSWTYTNGAFSYSLAGTQGIMLQLKDMTFAKDLKHNIRLAYYQGTNSASGVQKAWLDGSDPVKLLNPTTGAGSTNTMYLTTKDTAYEINVDTYYDIYKNLQLALELGYIKLNLSDKVWGKDLQKGVAKVDHIAYDNAKKKFFNDSTQDMTKITLGLRYTF